MRAEEIWTGSGRPSRLSLICWPRKQAGDSIDSPKKFSEYSVLCLGGLIWDIWMDLWCRAAIVVEFLFIISRNRIGQGNQTTHAQFGHLLGRALWAYRLPIVGWTLRALLPCGLTVFPLLRPCFQVTAPASARTCRCQVDQAIIGVRWGPLFLLNKMDAVIWWGTQKYNVHGPVDVQLQSHALNVDCRLVWQSVSYISIRWLGLFGLDGLWSKSVRFTNGRGFWLSGAEQHNAYLFTRMVLGLVYA